MKKLFFLGAMVCVFGLITACHDEGDEKNDILGEWQWVSTEVKCMDGYVGYDTTYNEHTQCTRMSNSMRMVLLRCNNK